MSLRNLVEDQCGTANSLVQLTTHFVQDKGLQEQGLLHPFQHEVENSDYSTNYVETADSPLAFRMDSLLSEMRDLEASSSSISVPSQGFSVDSKNENVSDWANQYIESGSTFSVNQTPFLGSIWSNEGQKANELELTKPFTNKFDLNANWDSEILNEPPPHFASIPDILAGIPPYPLEVSDMYDSEHILDSTSDPQLSNSKFLKFMNQVSGNNKVTEHDEPFSKWGNEANKHATPVAEETLNPVNIENHFSQWGSLPMANLPTTTERPAETASDKNEYSKELWSRLTERWEQLNAESSTPWVSEFEKALSSPTTYKFAEENPMKGNVNALTEGKKRLKEGDLPGAVLCFEAAVQQDENNIEAWQLLGRSQAENEQDPNAILALTKCLQLDPENLEALQELSVCYTNENCSHQACYFLKQWLAVHPKYRDIIDESNELNSVDGSDHANIMTLKLYNDVLNMYLKAVQHNINTDEEADPDLQNGLGVLLSINCEYDKATDCFETAVKLKPNDARLWNRLGATLANGEKPERALEAYRQTLQLRPGFVRARYNLGITCIHLKMYQPAVEHLLYALNQQNSGHGINGEKSFPMSDSIWTTLRLALSMMERKDLTHLAEKRNLEALNKEFGTADFENPTIGEDLK